MLEIFKEYSAVIVLLCIVFLISIGGKYLYGSFVCNQKASQMRVDCNYGLFSGCMIKIKDQWVPLDSYRVL